LRILHVVPTYLPATRYGGPIFAVHGLCRALAARGHEVEVFTTNVDGDGTSDVPVGKAVMLDGVKIHYLAATIRRVYYSPAMRTLLHKRVSDFDVVHAHSVFLWPTAIAARTAHAAGVPYLISPRGMLVPELVRSKSRFAKTAWITLVERRNFANACAIHFTSERELDDARRMKVPAPRAVVVPNGIDLPPLSPVPREPGLVLFLGRINWKKGVDRLIEAMQRVPDARLVVAGRAEGEPLPAAERVTFAGEVLGDEKDALLRRAEVLVLPSLSENFGNVVLEAMARSTPVIVTPGVGLAPDVQAGGAGLVAEGDPVSLAAAIERVLSDAALREEMGRRGRALVEGRFTWDRVAAEMESAYQSCSSASHR
jgi:glycosyltransferase involved in cell wall biosynthesis